MCPITSRILYKFPLVKQIAYSLIILTMLFGCRDSAAVKAQSSGSTTGSIVGKVIDSQGAVVSGATVSIKQIGTNLVRTIQTGDDGVYKILQLPPGEYELVARAENFGLDIKKTELNIGITRLIELVLPVGTASVETIDITASSVFEAEKTESSNSINRSRIDSLPINRRNFLDFTLTTPRVVQDRVPAQGVSASSGLSFNGQSARLNNITIDGLDNNETATGTVRATFSQEAVQEFQVVSDSFSTEFGHASGGVINIVTKGGSNDYHGSLFFLNRNDEISARDVFAPFEPDYKQYQFGATFSGPIKKDKIFFFSSFERLSIKQNQFVTIGDQTVVSARRLGFNLSNGPIPFSLGTTSLLGRLDLRLSPQNSFFIRYNFGGNYNGNFDPFGGLVGEGNAGIQRLEDNNVALNNTYISPNLGFIIESRFLYANRNQEIDQIVNEPQVRLVAPEGLVRFGRSTLLPQPRKTPIFQIVNNFTLVKGKNQIKFGVDFISINPDDKSTVPILNGGLAIFQPIDFTALTKIPNLPFFTGLQAFDPKLRTAEQLAFLDLASAQAPLLFPGFPKNVPLKNLPLPFAFAQGFGDTKVSVQQKIFSSFIQNDIKLTPNLLVKVGLRYDISRERFIPSNNGNFSPRLSVAYRPSKISNLSLRAAYGVFYGTQLFAIAATAELTTVKKSLVVPVVPFPFSILPFSLPEHRFPESNSIPSQINVRPQLNTTFQYDPGFRNGYTQQLTMGFNYLLTPNTQVAATYNYVRGVKLIGVRDINPVVRPIANNPLDSQINGRVDPTHGTVFDIESAFDSYYNGFTVAFDQRISKKLNFFAYYTFSKAIDDYLDIRFDLQETNNPLNVGGERSLSLQDARSRFVLSGFLELGEYIKTPVLKNSQVSVILNLESGHPYNLIAGQDLNLNADNPPGDRPNSLGRNVGILPGFAGLDLRFSKSINLKEKVRLQAFIEAFNIFNRVNISEVDRVFSPDLQGNFNLPKQSGGRFIAPSERFRNAFAPRQFQFGFRFTF